MPRSHPFLYFLVKEEKGHDQTRDSHQLRTQSTGCCGEIVSILAVFTPCTTSRQLSTVSISSEGCASSSGSGNNVSSATDTALSVKEWTVVSTVSDDTSGGASWITDVGNKGTASGITSVTFSATLDLGGTTGSLITVGLSTVCNSGGTVSGGIKRCSRACHNNTGSSGVTSNIQPGHRVTFKTVGHSFGGSDSWVVVFTAGDCVSNLGGTASAY